MTDETTWGEWLNAAQVGVVKRYGRDAANLYTEFLDAEYANRLEAYRALADEARKAVASWAGGQQVMPAMSRNDARDWLARYDALNGQEG